MEFGQLDGGDDGEHSGVSFVEISRIFATQDALFYGVELVDEVYICDCICQVERQPLDSRLMSGIALSSGITQCMCDWSSTVMGKKLS